jgi:Replication-relaxation
VRTHSHLTGEHIRRLFFRRPDGGLATVQAANTRLRKLRAGGFLVSTVVDGGHGSGPYAYTLGPNGRVLFRRLSAAPRSASAGPAWHAIEIAGLRVSLDEALNAKEGRIVEWMGEPAIRALVFGRRGWPIPDALCHWRLPDREGTFLLEWDRGSESLAILVEKLRRYDLFWRSHGHQQFLLGLRLRPRLAIVVATTERAERLARWLTQHRRPGSAVAVSVAADAFADPMGTVWWRSDLQRPGSLLT